MISPAAIRWPSRTRTAVSTPSTPALTFTTSLKPSTRPGQAKTTSSALSDFSCFETVTEPDVLNELCRRFHDKATPPTTQTMIKLVMNDVIFAFLEVGI